MSMTAKAPKDPETTRISPDAGSFLVTLNDPALVPQPEPAQTLPYLSFCLIVRNCASTLEACLQSIRARAPDAEIVAVDTCSRDDSGLDVFIEKARWPKDITDAEVETRLAGAGLKLLFIDEWATIERDIEGDLRSTQPAVRIRIRLDTGEKISEVVFEDAADLVRNALELSDPLTFAAGLSTVEIAQKYADVVEVYRGPKGDWTEEMKWFDDAAAARNRSFELAHGAWKAWMDSVTGETPVLIRRRSSTFIDYVEIRDLIYPSYREQRSCCYERGDYEVLTHQGWQLLRMVKQHKVKKPVFRIVDDGDVRVTQDHSLMSKGEAILGCDIRAVTDESPGTELDHVDQTIVLGLEVETITEALAEAWGFFAAEGWAGPCAGYDDRYLWSVTNTDQAKLQQQRDAFEIAHTRPFRIVSNGPRKDERSALVFRLEPQDPRDLGVLYREKFYSSGGRKKVPMEILNGTKEIKAAFLRGYEAGDGHVRRTSIDGRPLQSWSTNSPLLAAGLHYLYRTTGRHFYCNGPRSDKPTIISCVERSGKAFKSKRIGSAEIARIHALREQGLSGLAIGEELGIDWSTVYKILRGEPFAASDSNEPSIRKKIGVRHVVSEPEFEGWVYDLNTEAGTFVGGVGDFILHNSDDVLESPEETARLLQKNGRLQAPKIDGKHNVDLGNGKPVSLTELLRWFEREHPEIEALWCPYLYRMDEEGAAIEWQDRERFIRNPKNWTWKEAAHEVLVPINPRHQSPPGYLSHLLFVHHRRVTPESQTYALQRHWDVLIKKYDNEGERNSRNCFYLENYSRFMDPSRREEFIQAMYESAVTPIDRYRALLKAGEYAAEQGFLSDAMELYQGAVYHRPELPDAWLAGAAALDQAGDYLKSARWYVNAINCKHGLMDSEVNPRDHLIKYRIQAAVELRKGIPFLVATGQDGVAIAALDEAAQLADRVYHSDALNKADQFEATRYLNLFKNERDGLRVLLELKASFDYLIKNDETKKAADLVKLIPHNFIDHPIAIRMEKWAEKINRHLTDAEAYRGFYNDDVATGFLPSEELSEDAKHSVGLRSKFITDWLNGRALVASSGPLRVLEIGCLDGGTGLPILQECPNVEYTGVDIHKKALGVFRERAKKYLPDGDARLRLMESMDLDTSTGDLFDAVVFLEVIEHVPDPVASIKNLLKFVAPGGRLFLSTPWGAYDKGFADNTDTRDPRGHVRAMLPRDVVEAVEKAGGRVVELFGDIGIFGSGANLKIAIEALPDAGMVIMPDSESGIPGGLVPVPHPFRDQRPISFLVAGALWDWNASKVINDGIGASEETIVYLARQLGRSGRNVEVYGPLPHEVLVEEEVRDGVKYWPREQLRKLPKDAVAIVSRAPAFGAEVVPKIVGDRDRILWLQDSVYDDLNAETAKAYRKIVVLSEWHKGVIHEMCRVPLEQLAVMNNFLLPEHFRLAHPPKREPHHFIYASSPDRGLIDLLRIWPRILETWSDATLDIFYGWKGCIKLSATAAPGWVAAYRKVRTEYQALRFQRGIREVGMVSHDRIAFEMQRASAIPYPTTFLETWGSTFMKARAAGAVVVTTPIGALPESAGCPQTKFVEHTAQDSSSEFHFEAYTERFVEALKLAVYTPEKERQAMAEEAIERYKLEALYLAWLKLIDNPEEK